VTRPGLLIALLLLPALATAQPAVTVGSKRFTESYLLGEIVTQTVRAAGEARAVHQQGLGNTGIVFSALKSGAIDVYPEYTGTIAFELLGRKSALDSAGLGRELSVLGLAAGVPFGFNNTYALAMLESRAQALGVRTISDLARHATLKLGLSQEFLSRKDGWPGLKAAYGLAHRAPRGMDHGLAYEALSAGQMDVIDIYSTDAKVARYKLRVLLDDRGFFPAYDAVLIYRLDFPQRFPRSWRALQGLAGSISSERMAVMNGAVELDGRSFSDVASGFLAELQRTPGAADPRPRTDPTERRSFLQVLFQPDLARLTGEHMVLVFASLILSVLVGIPLGVWAAFSPRAGYWIFGGVSLLQTMPSLALLAFLITLTGQIGTLPAIAALFLYALLPIVRNTASGLENIPYPLRESARALGLPWLARLRLIELPMAAPSILAGIKTSAVINVGTATIAAFIGAGGYGERIVAGLAVNDNAMMLAGAIPAAVLALLIQWIFDLVGRRVVPAGLRIAPRQG
jgi:osmoprotectant transport system permease protein